MIKISDKHYEYLLKNTFLLDYISVDNYVREYHLTSKQAFTLKALQASKHEEDFDMEALRMMDESVFTYYIENPEMLKEARFENLTLQIPTKEQEEYFKLLQKMIGG